MTPHESNELKLIDMQVKAQQAVLASSEWLCAADIARLAGDVSLQDGAQLKRWEQDGQVFSILHDGQPYYPGYGLEIGVNVRPHPALADVVNVLRGKKSGWGMAYWFASVSSLLGGQRPLDLFKSELARVVSAAKEEVAGIVHG